MIMGINVNLIIEVLVGIALLYGLVLLAVAIFGGLSKAWTMLKYTAKFWWILAIIIGFIIIYISLTSKKKTIDTKIQDLNNIENKTEADQQQYNQLDAERKQTEDQIQKITDDFKQKLQDLNKQQPKPGDAGKSSDDLNNAWK